MIEFRIVTVLPPPPFCKPPAIPEALLSASDVLFEIVTLLSSTVEPPDVV
jgi:hypothetical protein